MTIIARLVRLCLIASILLEVGAIAGRAYVRWIRSHSGVQVGMPLPPLIGYGLDYAAGTQGAISRCVVYRAVSHRCVACAREEPAWQHFLAQPIAKKCSFVILIPRPVCTRDPKRMRRCFGFLSIGPRLWT